MNPIVKFLTLMIIVAMIVYLIPTTANLIVSSNPEGALTFLIVLAIFVIFVPISILRR